MQVRRIQMKTSQTPGELPAAMQHGEVAVNIPDALMYVGVDGAPPVVFGSSSPSVLDEGQIL